MNIPDDKIKKTLRYSIIDGGFYAAMVGIGESFFSAFAVFLNATNLQLGVLASLPQTLGSLAELYTNRLMRRFKSRKLVVTRAVLLQALMIIPITLVFFMGGLRVSYLLVFTALYWIFGMIPSPAWNSWMGDLVDPQHRGEYFGKRNKIASLVTFVTFVIGGLILQCFADGTMRQFIGFAIIFACAFVFRVISCIYLMKKYEPEYEVHPDAEFSLLDFIRQASHRNFGIFVIYLTFMYFAVFVASPFFTPYMLNDLHMDYKTYTFLIAIPIIIKYLTMPIWGKLSDMYGTKKVHAVAAFVMPILPLLWLLSRDIWFIALIQVLSGFSWAGFDLTVNNFIFDSTTTQKRATCVAYFHLLKGLGMFAGAMLGGLLIRYNSIFWSKYFLVFLLSGLLRYASSIVFIGRLREVRMVQSISYSDLALKTVGISPTNGVLQTLITFGKNGILRKPNLEQMNSALEQRKPDAEPKRADAERMTQDAGQNKLDAKDSH